MPEKPITTEPEMVSNPEKQVEAYDKWLEQGGDYDKAAAERGWQVPMLVYKELEPNLAKGQRLIDFACGTGLSAEPFQKAGLEMRGVDGSQELLKIANEKQMYSLGTEQAIIGRDEITAAHDYDYAISLGAMSIVPSAQQELLGALQKSLKPGGIAAFNYLDVEDYKDVETVETKDGEYVSSHSADQQQRFFHRRDTIVKACEELDFVPITEIEDVSYPLREKGKQNPTRIVIARYSPKT